MVLSYWCLPLTLVWGWYQWVLEEKNSQMNYSMVRFMMHLWISPFLLSHLQILANVNQPISLWREEGHLWFFSSQEWAEVARLKAVAGKWPTSLRRGEGQTAEMLSTDPHPSGKRWGRKWAFIAWVCGGGGWWTQDQPWSRLILNSNSTPPPPKIMFDLPFLYHNNKIKCWIVLLTL